MEFYIWSLGGDADRVGEALIAASKRGVKCRVLLDSLGSSSWFKSAWPDRFAKAKIEVTEALPIQFGRFQFRRAICVCIAKYSLLMVRQRGLAA